MLKMCNNKLNPLNFLFTFFFSDMSRSTFTIGYPLFIPIFDMTLYFYVFMFSLYILAHYIEIHIHIVIKKWVTNCKVKPMSQQAFFFFPTSQSEKALL